MKVTALDKYFKVPKDLDLDQFIGDSLGMFVGKTPKNFKIRIDPPAARWVFEDPWHPDQQVKQLRDGAIELTVKATHELEIVPRVLALGAKAELLSPASTRSVIKNISKQLASTYR